MKRYVAALLAFAALPCLGASGETFNIRAKSGAATVIGGTVAMSRDDCLAMAVSPTRVARPPAHGKVDIRAVQGRLPSGLCVGAIARGLQFVYTPAKGYRGTDEVTIEYEWTPYVDAASRSVRTNLYRITVE